MNHEILIEYIKVAIEQFRKETVDDLISRIDRLERSLEDFKESYHRACRGYED